MAATAALDVVGGGENPLLGLQVVVLTFDQRLGTGLFGQQSCSGKVVQATSTQTGLRVESFLDPDLSLVPSSFVNSGAREGIRDAIVALKARCEGRGGPR